MLKKRIITACILIIVVLGILIYLPPPAFCILVGLIALGGAWEWSGLMKLEKKAWRWGYLFIVFCTFIIALFLPVPAILAVTFIWWLIAALFVLLYPRGGNAWGKGMVWRGIMGILVLTPCWVAVNYIRNQPSGLYALIFLFVLIWGADSAAYFVGRKWGKTKLAPRVSPGKSWQGFFGALVFSLIIALVASWICHVPVTLWPFGLALSLVTVIFSVLGDLFESMIKRQAGVKDSGTLLPGHGGLLDRIDSLTAAAPIFAFYAWLLSTYAM